MKSLRQVTACPHPATVTITGARSRHDDYTAMFCASHASHCADGQQWPGRRSATDPGIRCGTVRDQRAFIEIVRSHGALWLLPLTGYGPTNSEHDWRCEITQARDIVEATARRHNRYRPVAVGLTRAVILADQLPSRGSGREDGQAAILEALSTAETAAAEARRP